MTKDELKLILEKHQGWIKNEDGGERADLRDANLCGADLCGADLRWAHLRRADLRRANLYKADLREANLHMADLSGANLSYANLREAVLCGANLREAVMHGTDLYEVSLNGVDLSGVNLYGADLRGANLDGTNQILAVGPIGSRRDITFYHISEDMVRCGCFSGTLKEFAARIDRLHRGHPVHLSEYRAAVAFMKAVKEARRVL
jgi:hypothetical protein